MEKSNQGGILIYLKADQITYKFGHSTLLDDLSFSIPKGELLTIIGPSGEGKTTLLKIISGLISDYGGTIRLADQPIDHLSARERGCILVGSSTPLFEHMTVFQNIAFGLHLKKMSKALVQSKVDALLKKINLFQLSGRRPHQISQGQYQRILLARALILSPKLILLDEPLSNIDPTLKIEFRAQIMGMLQDAGTTAVMVTHDMEDAFYMSHKVGVLLHKQLTMLCDNGHPIGKNSEVEHYLGGLEIIRGRVGNHRFSSPQVTMHTTAEDGTYRMLLTGSQSILLDRIDVG